MAKKKAKAAKARPAIDTLSYPCTRANAGKGKVAPGTVCVYCGHMLADGADYTVEKEGRATPSFFYSHPTCHEKAVAERAAKAAAKVERMAADEKLSRFAHERPDDANPRNPADAVAAVAALISALRTVARLPGYHLGFELSLSGATADHRPVSLNCSTRQLVSPTVAAGGGETEWEFARPEDAAGRFVELCDGAAARETPAERIARAEHLVGWLRRLGADVKADPESAKWRFHLPRLFDTFADDWAAHYREKFGLEAVIEAQRELIAQLLLGRPPSADAK